MSDPAPGAPTGIEHFQAAARELIAAFRSVLDVAEELVEDPDSVKGAVRAFGDMARQAARQAAGFAAAAADDGADGGDDGGGGGGDGGIEHIDIE